MLHENALLSSPSEMHHFLLAKKLQYCVGGVFLLIILQIPYFQHAFDKTSHTGYPTASIA